jgi:hypothetical protein
MFISLHPWFDLRRCPNSFRYISPQCALLRPHIKILWCFIIRIVSTSIAASLKQWLIAYYEFKKYSDVSEFSDSPECVNFNDWVCKEWRNGWLRNIFCLRNALTHLFVLGSSFGKVGKVALNLEIKLGTVARSCIPSTWETKAGVSRVPGQLGLPSEILLSQKNQGLGI